MTDASDIERRAASARTLSLNGFRAAVGGLALIGSWLLWISTRWGAGLYPDSIVYVGTARKILEGGGVYFLNDIGTIAPVTQYPPLYPATIAMLGLAGLDPLDGARWISIFCYGANALLAAYIIYRSTASYGASLLGCFLALSAFPMIYIHSQALTEPMFTFLIFSAFALLASYLHGARPWMLYGSALVIGLSCLVRYVGIAFILAGAVAILCSNEAHWRRRFSDAFKFGVLSSLPLGLWALRNLSLTGNAVNRTFSFHPPALRDFLPGADTIGQWLIPITVVEGAPGLSRAITAALIVALCWLARRVDLSQSQFPRLLVIGVMGYGLFLLTSWSINDQPLYLDTRTMTLPYLASMILAVAILAHRLRAARPNGKSWRRLAVDCSLIIILGLQTINGAAWLRYSYVNGIGFSIEQWRSSALLNFVRNAPAPLLVYSNAPDFIYTLTGRPAQMIPHKVDPDSRVPNQQYAADTAAMGEQLKQSNAVLIYFNDEDRLWYLPSKTEMETHLPLRVIKGAKDGTIYGLKNFAR